MLPYGLWFQSGTQTGFAQKVSRYRGRNTLILLRSRFNIILFVQSHTAYKRSVLTGSVEHSLEEAPT